MLVESIEDFCNHRRTNFDNWRDKDTQQEIYSLSYWFWPEGAKGQRKRIFLLGYSKEDAIEKCLRKENNIVGDIKDLKDKETTKK